MLSGFVVPSLGQSLIGDLGLQCPAKSGCRSRDPSGEEFKVTDYGHLYVLLRELVNSPAVATPFRILLSCDKSTSTVRHRIDGRAT